jgi:ferredoxin
MVMPLLTVILLTGDSVTIEVGKGDNLRQALLHADISPYTRVTQSFNCGGRGLCATCGVWIDATGPLPTHWHDQLAAIFRYPRLSCQIKVEQDMTIRLVDKWVWGGRETPDDSPDE